MNLPFFFYDLNKNNIFSRDFHHVNKYLTKAYWTLSVIGYMYDDQNEFQSAYVKYHKTHLIKSTRHLNVYKNPIIVREFLIIF